MCAMRRVVIHQTPRRKGSIAAHWVVRVEVRVKLQHNFNLNSYSDFFHAYKIFQTSIGKEITNIFPLILTDPEET